MQDFTFDLQRFTASVGSVTDFQNAITSINSGTATDNSIEFTASFSSNGSISISGASASIDLNSNTSNNGITIAEGSYVTLTGGTITSSSTNSNWSLVTNLGVLTVDSMTLSGGSFDLTNSSKGLATITDTTVSLSSGQSISYRDSTAWNPETYSMTGGAATFVFGSSSSGTGEVTVQNLSAGDAFSFIDDSGTVNYTVTSGGLIASHNG